MKLVILILNLIILNSCGASKNESAMNDSNKNANTNETLSGTYTVNLLKEYKTIPTEITLEFDAETNNISGFAGCNRFFGTYKISGNTLSFSEMASTKKLCKRFMDLEQYVQKTISETTNFSLENNTLTLLNDKMTLIKADKEIVLKRSQDIDYSIEYSAITRGSYTMITLKDNTLSIQKAPNAKPILKTLSQEKLNNLSDIVETIDLKTLQNLEPPSKAFQYDGAPIATLKITHNGETYQTPSFDHGNPPKAIEALVTQLLSLSEKVE